MKEAFGPGTGHGVRSAQSANFAQFKWVVLARSARGAIRTPGNQNPVEPPLDSRAVPTCRGLQSAAGEQRATRATRTMVVSDLRFDRVPSLSVGVLLASSLSTRKQRANRDVSDRIYHLRASFCAHEEGRATAHARSPRYAALGRAALRRRTQAGAAAAPAAAHACALSWQLSLPSSDRGIRRQACACLRHEIDRSSRGARGEPHLRAARSGARGSLPSARAAHAARGAECHRVRALECAEASHEDRTPPASADGGARSGGLGALVRWLGADDAANVLLRSSKRRIAAHLAAEDRMATLWTDRSSRRLHDVANPDRALAVSSQSHLG